MTSPAHTPKSEDVAVTSHILEQLPKIVPQVSRIVTGELLIYNIIQLLNI